MYYKAVHVSIAVSRTSTELLVKIKISLLACGSEHACRHYRLDVTHACIARKIPMQMPTEMHNFEKCL